MEGISGRGAQSGRRSLGLDEWKDWIMAMAHKKKVKTPLWHSIILMAWNPKHPVLVMDVDGDASTTTFSMVKI